MSDQTPERLCECDCGLPVVRRFRIGHDAKLKSRLIATALSETATPKARAAAEARIGALGWQTHLAISREMREKQAARKARQSKPATRAAVSPIQNVNPGAWEPPSSAKPTPPAPAEEVAHGDGRMPASVRKLSGKIGRRPRQAATAPA